MARQRRRGHVVKRCALTRRSFGRNSLQFMVEIGGVVGRQEVRLSYNLVQAVPQYWLFRTSKAVK